MLTVSPSPRDLFAKLSDDEKIAIDLLLQGDADDDQLGALVPTSARRAYLQTLAVQLRALGVTLGESAALDQSCKGWQAAGQWYREEQARMRERAETERQEERRRDEALPVAVRKAVRRHRRRQQRRP